MVSTEAVMYSFGSPYVLHVTVYYELRGSQGRTQSEPAQAAPVQS